jgi:hypothetical protein
MRSRFKMRSSGIDSSGEYDPVATGIFLIIVISIVLLILSIALFYGTHYVIRYKLPRTSKYFLWIILVILVSLGVLGGLGYGTYRLIELILDEFIETTS